MPRFVGDEARKNSTPWMRCRNNGRTIHLLRRERRSRRTMRLCGTYAQYALAQRLRLPESIQNLPRDEIATWFRHHPQYSGRLKALAGECESSCAKCGDWTCR
jgi:hypothetical protein